MLLQWSLQKLVGYVIYFFFKLKLTGNAITKPANAPTIVDVLVADETKQDEGSHPAKDAKANPIKLPIAVNNSVIFIKKVK